MNLVPFRKRIVSTVRLALNKVKTKSLDEGGSSAALVICIKGQSCSALNWYLELNPKAKCSSPLGIVAGAWATIDMGTQKMDYKRILEALLIAILSVFTASCNTEFNLNLDINMNNKTIIVYEANESLEKNPIDL